ncbi:MAG: hypothetical protein EBU82_02390 [Flavobacteriia bacterium]|nr:hypothetical protein [Flavobacteriia bacterium]
MDKLDTVIVGAGIGGLYLAEFLEQKNLPYCMVEASQRLGGRIHTHVVDGISFELGAARILSSQTRAMQLIQRFSLELEEHVVSDASIYWEGIWHDSLNGLLSTFHYPEPLDLFHEMLTEAGIASLKEFELHAPKEWDTILTKDWLASKGVPFKFAKLYFLGDIDVNLSQITLYESLYFYAANLKEPEAKIYRLKDGMGRLIAHLASKIKDPLMGETVQKVTYHGKEVRITTTERTLEARNVVFTCSLNALQRVQLPHEARKNLEQWLRIGHYGKSLKGRITLNQNPYPNQSYMLSDDPIRMLRRSAFDWELYVPSLNQSWSEETLRERVEEMFGENTLVELKLQNYMDAPFYGCYWNYTRGNFNRIFDASQTLQLASSIYCVGEHFSMNPNWIEGTLESVSNLINTHV